MRAPSPPQGMNGTKVPVTEVPVTEPQCCASPKWAVDTRPQPNTLPLAPPELGALHPPCQGPGICLTGLSHLAFQGGEPCSFNSL